MVVAALYSLPWCWKITIIHVPWYFYETQIPLKQRVIRISHVSNSLYFPEFLNRSFVYIFKTLGLMASSKWPNSKCILTVTNNLPTNKKHTQRKPREKWHATFKTCRIMNISNIIISDTRSYLHETVISILVAGTVLFNGSNSPIDAIAAPREFEISLQMTPKSESHSSQASHV